MNFYETMGTIMEGQATLLAEVPLPADCAAGTFFGPRIYELTSLDQLTREVFGPVLHILRYKAKDMDKVLDQIRATGFGPDPWRAQPD